MGEQQQVDDKPAGDDKGGKPDYTPPATQEEFEARLKDRLARERAKFADYEDLKKKASKFDELDAASKSDLEKANARAEAAEAKALELEQKNLRNEVAAAKGVPADLISGATKEDLESSADALIAFRGKEEQKDLYLPNADKTPSKLPADSTEFVRGLFGNN